MILQCDDIDNVLSFLTSLRSHCTSWPWSQWCSQFNQVLILSKSILTVNIKIHLNNQHPNPSKRSTSKSICTVNIWTVNIQIHLNGQQQSTSVNIQIHLSGQLIQIHRNRSYPNPPNRQLTKAFWPAAQALERALSLHWGAAETQEEERKSHLEAEIRGTAIFVDVGRCPPAVELQVKKTFLLRYRAIGECESWNWNWSNDGPLCPIIVLGSNGSKIQSNRNVKVNPLNITQVRRNRQLYPKVILNVGGEKHEVIINIIIVLLTPSSYT